ncbi:MAG: ParB/RepB/Spo0J family partition protein, partial [Leptospirillia bacterium]
RIIDGRNRYRASRAVGCDVATQVFEGSDAELVGFVISLNLRRRHLNESQRAMAAAKLATLTPGQGQMRKFAHLPSQSDTAEMLGVGRRSVQHARQVQTHAAPNVVEAVEAGQVSVSAAAVLAKAVPKDEQKGLTVADIKRAAREAVLGDTQFPTKKQAIARAKETGAPVLAEDGKYHSHTTPDNDLNTLMFTILHTHTTPDLSPEAAVECVPENLRKTVQRHATEKLAWFQQFTNLWREEA